MAVAFDAVGPSSAGKTSTTSPSSWTHTAVASGVAILVGIGYGHAAGTNGTVAVTCDGNPMTQLGAVSNNNSTAGQTLLFGIANQASGAHTIAITVTGGAGSLTLESGSLSYSGAGTTTGAAFGSAVTAFGDSSVSGTQTVTVTGTTAGNMVGAVSSIGISTLTNPVTSRWTANFSNSNGAGNAGQVDKAAGGSVTCTWTNSGGGDFWGAVAVEIKAAGGGATATPPAVRPARAAPGIPDRTGTGRGSPGTLTQAITGTPGQIAVTAPAGTVTAVTGTAGRTVRAQRLVPRGKSFRPSQGIAGTAVTGTPGIVTVTGLAGTVTAVTGSPGKTARRPLPVPRRGSGRGIFTTTSVSANVAGVTGAVTVTAPAGTIQAVTGSPGRASRALPLVRRGRHSPASPGTLGSSIPGAAGTVAAAAPAGTVQAVTGSPGRVVARARPQPRRGTGTGIFAVASAPGVVTGSSGLIIVTAIAGTVTTTSAAVPASRPARSKAPALPRRGTGTGRHGTAGTAIAGPAGSITVTAPAGTATAVTGTAGRLSRARPALLRHGTGHGSKTAPIAVPAAIAGPAGAITASAPAGSVAAVTGSPGRAVRARPRPPRRGTGRGIFTAVTAVIPGSITGSPGRVTAAAPAGTVTADRSTAVAGPAGKLTLAAVAGTVTAVTGTRGRTVRSRTAVPPHAPKGHGQHGTAGAAAHGTTGLITVRGLPGTVTAVTGTRGHAVRARTAVPPRRGTGTGRHGTAGTAVAAPAGTAAVTGTGGGINVTVNGPAGTVAATGIPGLINLTPFRYVRWRIRPGFASTTPRSHVIAGSPGRITVRAPFVSIITGTPGQIAVTAPPGTVTGTHFTGAHRPARAAAGIPGRRGKER